MNTSMPIQTPRGPNMNGPPQFGSPGVPNLGLPGVQGSPHVSGSAQPSPGQAHLAAPGMVQPNQNVPGAQGAGQITSPNVSSKRRRASTVKVESDDTSGPAEVNGATAQGAAKVKASPRVGKRQKNAG